MVEAARLDTLQPFKPEAYPIKVLKVKHFSDFADGVQRMLQKIKKLVEEGSTTDEPGIDKHIRGEYGRIMRSIFL